MANQVTVQVYAIDNIPQRSALNVSFPTGQISAQLATSVLATNIQSQINYYPNPNNQAQLTEVLVSQSIGAIATLAGSSMFAASIYKINGYPQGGQALSMLFPSVQPSIWNVSGGGDVHSFVQFKGKKYYAHETSAALATAANAGDTGGGGLVLESYQNSAMSAAVMAYVYRDESDNIFGVYEPTRNNKVFRSQFAYADSIDVFPFDSVVIYNNTLNDVKLIDIASDAVIQGCALETMVINGNSHTGFQLINHTHKGNYGQDYGVPEITIIGDNVLFTGLTCNEGCTFFDVGANADFENSSFGSQARIYVNKAVGASMFYLDMGDDTEIEYFVDNQRIANCTLMNYAYLYPATGSSTAFITMGSHSFIEAHEVGVNYNIVSLNQGAKTFTVSGVHTVAFFTKVIEVESSTGNNRYYSVVSVTDNGTNTTITVNEAIASSVADGTLQQIQTFNKLQSVAIGSDSHCTLAAATDLVELTGVDVGSGMTVSFTGNQTNKSFYNPTGTP